MLDLNNREDWIKLLTQHWIMIYTIIGKYTKHANKANLMRNHKDYEGLASIICETVANAPMDGEPEKLDSWFVICSLCETSHLVSKKK